MIPISLVVGTVNGVKSAGVFKLIIGSLILNVLAPMLTLLPVTVKLPPIVTLPDITAIPPTYKLPPIPVPPVTCKAPVVVLVAAVAEVCVVTPLDVSVVNAPVAVVLAPIGKLSANPPVIRALPVLKFVITPSVAYTFATLLI